MKEARSTPFGRYRLIELLGRGGMGEVWKAFDTEANRLVALKLLPTQLSADTDFQRRFRREAHAAARLSSPHVIPIHQYGEIDGRLYLDMRLIDGRDLASVLAEGPLDPNQAVDIVSQVARALHAAHQQSLLHRDVKPSNIVLDHDDFAYLIDFGIARTIGETRMTQPGYAMGSFRYIAPERLVVDADEDARADIYSLACVLYECLTGKPPFPGDDMPRLVAAHLNAPPPRPSLKQPKLPTSVDEVITRGMAKHPDDRYATTVALADAARHAVNSRSKARTTVAATQPLVDRVAADSISVNSPASRSALVRSYSPKSRPAPPALTKSNRMGRRAKTLISGTVVLAAVIAAAIIIPGGGQHAPTQNPSGSLTVPTTSAQSSSTQLVLPFADLNRPFGVAVDTTGAIFVADRVNNRVIKLAAGSNAQDVLPFTGLDHPLYVAVDTAGAVYVADASNNRVLKLEAGTSTQRVLPFIGLNLPSGVAVDAAGAVYVADTNNNRVLKLARGSSSQQALPFTGLDQPDGLAVGTNGALYVTSGGNRVLMLLPDSSLQEARVINDLIEPLRGLAVDAAGALYVSDVSSSRVFRIAVNSSTQQVLPFTGLSRPLGIAVDNSGAVYVADSGNGRVLRLPSR
ncbi:hypothetical protein A5725_07335 [Mycobacterium kubicae]|uniref:serine/threonine-protein kinase PknD n=1 Tax=Mycobacterium kubicae TaxID=120959 RepID=UPI0007FEF37F|nr:serine/threonine-protein kinase PknD [Mycobacterium kubicae]OBF24407.1 hypothetical protein A5725_07335 [Mycobacterium kubicae]